MSDTNNKPHFILHNNGQKEKFRTPVVGRSSDIPHRLREQHGRHLHNQLQRVATDFTHSIEQQKEECLEADYGLLIEFESFPNAELAFESLDRSRSKIELRNIRKENKENEDEVFYATVFVPDGKLGILEQLIVDYLNPDNDTNKGPKNSTLLNAIADIRTAALEALWTDSPNLLPFLDEEAIWWEVWLPNKADATKVITDFRHLAIKHDLTLKKGEIFFPDRSVLLLFGSKQQIKQSSLLLNSIAELRRANETADFFDSFPPEEQQEWCDELLSRITPYHNAQTPYVCLLDTGINHGHPLLKPFINANDLHSVEPAWGVTDSQGHGTSMAGLAILGNLTEVLSSSAPINVTSRLESVKLLDTNDANGKEPELHGYLTLEAVNRPYINAPERRRVFSMAVTAKGNRNFGRPSAWSAAIDRLTYGNEIEDANSTTPKLFIVSAGNIDDQNAWQSCPVSNSADQVHDPGQAWNALTVGAMTNLADVTGIGTSAYQSITKKGGLSPFSTTSCTWDKVYPYKPDVVFEGGNAAVDTISAVTMPSLSLLTTDSQIHSRLFTTATGTSPSSALAANMAANIMAQYPDLWPESVRGLLVHSAQWTDEMLTSFNIGNNNYTKGQIHNLIRHCGFGVPNLNRALWSVNNSLTIMCEDSLQPFNKSHASSSISLGDMNFHQLPWPSDELLALGETEVEMRATLSYFIEPNPSSRVAASRYRYQSHGLRFDVKRSLESIDSFKARINQAIRDEDYDNNPQPGYTGNWLVGDKGRTKGSIHSDIWRGTAADLATQDVIGIYPTHGWWSKRTPLKRYENKVRYSLIISINTPTIGLDLYTPIVNKIRTIILA